VRHGAGGNERWEHVSCGRGISDVAADGRPVTNLNGGEYPGGSRQAREDPAQSVGDSADRGHGGYFDMTVVSFGGLRRVGEVRDVNQPVVTAAATDPNHQIRSSGDYSTCAGYGF
jgi:hypothetical protein